ncbi:MAG: tetratricopeptide repeat protein [Bacteroidales bacterium]|nr:tetratricopeptide repeat protein [Bacteroidales bacterium]
MKIRYNGLILLDIILFSIGLIQCTKRDKVEVIPSIAQVSESHVAISWKSKSPYVGKVYYKAVGSKDKKQPVATDKLGKTMNHEVEIQGLQPSTQYLYWIDGMEKKYQFQTKSVQNGSFAFLLTTDSDDQNYVAAVQAEACSFVLTNNQIRSEKLNACAPYVPIFTVKPSDWSIDWSGLWLVVLDKDTDISLALNATGCHTLGVLVSSELINNLSKDNPFHQKLLAHNETSSTPVSFVGIFNSNASLQRLDGIAYFGLAQGKSDNDINSFTLVMNVDVESTSAFFISGNKELMLKEPPLQGKRTCQDCRRLAEKGAYEEGIKAYKQFIESNKGNYQIDDAYFAIAEIYDSKLFQFPQALEWYNRLVKDFSSSSLVPLANQRISYISNYNDADFKPLAAFERIKTQEFAKAKSSQENQVMVLDMLAEIIAQYPNSKLVPVMQLWIANQYQLINVEKAIDVYAKLINQYPDFSKTNEVLIKMGETYYNNSQWDRAYEIYVKAASQYSNLKETIDSQLKRIKRNIVRIQLNYITQAILYLILLVMILLPPRELKFSGWKTLLLGFIINFTLLFFFSWIYREEFPSVQGMTLLVLALSTAIILSVFTAITFTNKSFFKNRFLSILFGNLLGVITLICGLYQGIYHIYVHYLVVLGL